MISAVAARRAAAAAATGSLTPAPQSAPTTTATTSQGDDDEDPATKPSSKRSKPPTPGTTRNTKKAKIREHEKEIGGDGQIKAPLARQDTKKPASKKQRKSQQQQQPRYFSGTSNGTKAGKVSGEEDHFKEGKEVIDIVPTSDEASSEDDGEGEPLSSSSSDEAEEEGPVSTENAVLSTFDPTLDENVFQLSPDECIALGTVHGASVLLLQPHEALCLLGTCSLRILYGKIEMLGTTLSADEASISHRIFAPSSAPLPIIRCSFPSPAKSSSSKTPPSCRGSSLLSFLPERIQSILKDDATLLKSGSILLFAPLSTGVEKLGIVCRLFEDVFVPSKWQRQLNNSADRKSDGLGVDGLFVVHRQSRDVVPFVLPTSWLEALDELLSPISSSPSTSLHPTPSYSLSNMDDAHAPSTAFLVKGPRNSGKSTFARTLLNRLLGSYERVAFLECDLGQSEFTPPGMVSLNVLHGEDGRVFGPPFTHLTIPYAAHYVGATTPRSMPDYYLEAVRALVDKYQRDFADSYGYEDEPMQDDAPNTSSWKKSRKVPLVVNTMGWTKGLGADLNARIEELVREKTTYDLSPADPIHFGALSKRWTSADWRTLSLMSWFYGVFSEAPSSLTRPSSQHMIMRWNISEPLLCQPPLEASIHEALDRLVLCGAGYEDVPPGEVGRVVNGAIVGVVVRDRPEEGDGAEGWHDEEDEEGEKRTNVWGYEQASTPPALYDSRCIGLALVRGVHPSLTEGAGENPGATVEAKVQLLSPLPVDELVKGRVWVKGELEMPVWGMVDWRGWIRRAGVDGSSGTTVPYLQWGRGDLGGRAIGGEKKRVRRNLMRKGQQ
ncbi:hypothetical protein BKA70DRAFT_1131662 [Coprinopsis sp. MPI-PUGE-AT-0042]|nr:hypothetical protein BKA70DRAFT_1131662 [Coprinopsis sp. MPI-PUGE-AT-0042]